VRTFPAFVLLGLSCGGVACGEEPWTPLFNGKDLQSWNHVGDGSFEIENGQLKTHGGMGLLWYTPQKLSNVRIKVLYRVAAGSNAGVFIRIPEKPTEAWMPVNRGYEVQIDDTEDEYHITGVLYSLTKAKTKPPHKEGWNELLITLEGDRTTAKVNGMLITDFREGDPVPPKTRDSEPDRGPRPAAGYIGLQNHSDTDVVYFKEISYQHLAGTRP